MPQTKIGIPRRGLIWFDFFWQTQTIPKKSASSANRLCCVPTQYTRTVSLQTTHGVHLFVWEVSITKNSFCTHDWRECSAYSFPSHLCMLKCKRFIAVAPSPSFLFYFILIIAVIVVVVFNVNWLWFSWFPLNIGFSQSYTNTLLHLLLNDTMKGVTH